MSDLIIRHAQPIEVDVRAIYDLLSGMFDEQPMQRLNPEKAMAEIHRVCEREAAWVVEEGERIVATAGMVDATVFYSDDVFLVTRWLYALPEHRGAEGAWKMMMDEIKLLSSMTGSPALIDVYNPLKTRKVGRLEVAFARFRFDPAGVRMRFEPEPRTAELEEVT